MPLHAPKKIYTYVFDADGCILNTKNNNHLHSQYLNHLPQYSAVNLETIRATNQSLFETIRIELEKDNPDDVVIMSGSSRESFLADVDKSVRNSTPGFFFTLIEIEKILKLYHPTVRLDRFLMRDLYLDQEPGTEFNRAINSTNFRESEEEPTCQIDASKQLNLLALCHYTSQNSSDKDQLVLNFYDDQPDILNNINALFSKYPALIPSKLLLNLYHYDGGVEVTQRFSIQGKGANKDDYQKIIRDLSSDLVAPNRHNKLIRSPAQIIPQLLQHFVPDSERQNTWKQTISDSINAVRSTSSDWEQFLPSAAAAAGNDEQNDGALQVIMAQESDTSVQASMAQENDASVQTSMAQENDASVQTSMDQENDASVQASMHQENDASVQANMVQQSDFSVPNSLAQSYSSSNSFSNSSSCCCCCCTDSSHLNILSLFNQSSATNVYNGSSQNTPPDPGLMR